MFTFFFRYFVLSKPFKTLSPSIVRKRARYSYLFGNLSPPFFRVMVGCSWLVSGLLSSPQAILFRKVKHPNREFYQCTPDFFLEMHSNIAIKNKQLFFSFFGIDPKIIDKIYNFSFLFPSTFSHHHPFHHHLKNDQKASECLE